MQDYLSETFIQRINVFWCILIIIGLFLAEWIRVLPSIGVAGLFLTGIVYAVKNHRIAQQHYWPQLLSATGVFILHLINDLARSNIFDKLVQQDLLLQSPFLLLPIAFILLPRWPIEYKRLIAMVLIGCCIIASSGATINYILHSQQIEQMYLQSKVMPTEPDHIRFSLLISMAVMTGLLLLANRQVCKVTEYAVGVSVAILFLFQHLLAVRSGLASMYIAILFWLCWLGVVQRRWRAAFIISVIAVTLSGASLCLFPTLQNKIVNTRLDTEQLSTVQSANNYSVTARVYSYDVAWILIKQHSWLGVGKLDLADKMAAQYSYKFPEIKSDHYVLPHNQFIYNLAAYGIVGLLYFLFCFYYPVFSAFRERNILFLLICLIVTVSFTVEYTLESHIGVLIGIFFGLLALAPTSNEKPNSFN